MRVLAIGAHPDDIELGCGGALLAHAARGDEITMLVLTQGERGRFVDRSRFDEQRRAARILGATLRWGPFVDGEVSLGPDLVRVIDDVIAECDAQIVYTHAAEDSHQDHRAASQASLAAARRLSSVLYYETPSTQRFQPNVFVDVSADLQAKLALVRSHASQVSRVNGPVDLNVLVAQAKFRGSQGRTSYAEGFELARFLWDMATPDIDGSAPVPVTDRLPMAADTADAEVALPR